MIASGIISVENSKPFIPLLPHNYIYLQSEVGTDKTEREREKKKLVHFIRVCKEASWPTTYYGTFYHICKKKI